MRLKTHRKLVQNVKGEVFYGVHMYPGISEFIAGPGEASQLFISDSTIRKMGPTLAGCPIFCVHKKPEGSLDVLRGEADGWVESSFFNEADGLHWIKFIVTSSKALESIGRGFGLSNGYDITREGPGGSRNGVSYDLEVLDGEFHHVAIVKDPRYESIILTPDEFKAYNAEKHAELKRVANSKDTKKGISMGNKSGISFFSRKKVDNSKDYENLSVILPKSGVEKSISELVKIADIAVQNEGKGRICNEDDRVLVEEDGEEKEVTIAELVAMIAEIKEELAELRALDDDEIENEDDEDDSEDEDDEDVENEDDEDDDEEPKEKVKNKKVAKNSEKPKALSLDKKEKKAENKAKSKPAKVQNSSVEGKRRARDIRNAHTRGETETSTYAIDTPASKIARGLNRYG